MTQKKETRYLVVEQIPVNSETESKILKHVQLRPGSVSEFLDPL